LRTGAVSPRVSGGLPHSCDIAEWRLILLRDNELPKAEAAALRRHLRRCVRCRESHRFLDALLAAVREVRIPDPDDPFWDRMREQIMAKVRAMRPA